MFISKRVVYLYTDNSNEAVNLILFNMSHKVRSNSTPNESFAKLKSTCGLNGELDIHGFTWDERVVLEVTAFDRTAGKVVVRNCNGLSWVSDLKSMEFCTEQGLKIVNP